MGWTITVTVAVSVWPFASTVYSKVVAPSNGPGACRKDGNSDDPVNIPHNRKIVAMEITLAVRSETTALSSPKVTVFSEV